MYTHDTSIRFKVLVGVFVFLANVALVQQISALGIPGDALQIVASVRAVAQQTLSPREEARRSVRAKLSTVRPRRDVKSNNSRGIKDIVRYRRPRPTITDAPPVIIKRSDVPERSRCGDKIILLSEECDDGNAFSGDGCSSSCMVEAGFSCHGQPSICLERCGDGKISSSERCDDGNVDGGDGCNAQCRVESGFSCTGTPSACSIIPVCGNRTIETPETCDDGNVLSGDGCSETCKTE